MDKRNFKAGAARMEVKLAAMLGVAVQKSARAVAAARAALPQLLQLLQLR